MYIATFFLELFFLFLLSKQLTFLLSYAIHRLTRSTKITINIMAFLFFPGTFIHELAHALIASLLGAHVYHIEFFPKLHGDSLKLGSVAIARVDIFRRMLIGMAPFLVGTSLLLLILFSVGKYQLFDNIPFTILLGYLVFEIGNTMFSSKKDLEGAIEVLLLILFITGAFYFLGFRIPALAPQILLEHPLLTSVFQHGSMLLLIPICIDLVLILLLKILSKQKHPQKIQKSSV